ncbi:MAG: hypothetical protein RIB32_01185 [Phycisphaerales bacterium]
MPAPSDRVIPHSFLARHAMAIAVGVLLITAMLPASWLGWASWFGSLVDTAVTPIADPVRITSGIFTPDPRRAEPEQLRLLLNELERERLARLQAEQRNIRMAQQIAQLTQGAAINPDVPVVQVPALVVGDSGGLLLVRAGTAQGLTPDAVATVDGVQLLGALERADHRTCRVRPITHRGTPSLRAAIMLDEFAATTLDCLLTPTGDGALRGDVMSAGDAPPEIAEGATVRLRDDAWPEHAQMLIVGTVERVEPHKDDPLRRVVTVRPTVPLSSARDVVFRVPSNSDRGATP